MLDVNHGSCSFWRTFDSNIVSYVLVQDFLRCLKESYLHVSFSWWGFTENEYETIDDHILFAQAVIIYIPIADDVKKQAGCWLSDSGCLQCIYIYRYPKHFKGRFTV